MPICWHLFNERIRDTVKPTAETPFANEEVLQTFLSFPDDIQPELMALRELIFETAAATEGVGALEETLKWGEPAYLTSQSKSGSTVRMGWKRSNPGQYALYFICRTHLVERFRTWFPDELRFDGNRAILFKKNQPVSVEAVRACIAAALTYHRDKHNS